MNDNTFICVGSVSGSLFENTGGGKDAIAFKADFQGNLIWQKQLGADTQSSNNIVFATSGDDACLSIAMDSDGNILCGGKTSELAHNGNQGGDDGFILKLDPNGNIFMAPPILVMHTMIHVTLSR